MNPCSQKTAAAQKGVAVIVAISVIAILTILVMALAYSAGISQHQAKLETAKMQADNLLRAGLDMAVVALSRLPGGITEKKDLEAKLDDSTCHMTATPADPSHPIYGGNFLDHRPGDVILTVTVEKTKGVGPHKVSQAYLLNVDPARPRRLAFDEKLFAQAKTENPKP